MNFPLPKAAPQPDSTSEPRSHAGIGAMQLMIVDDQPAALNLTKGMLAEMGVKRCLAVTDPRRALSVLLSKEVRLDAVLCDWRMPGMSGLELLQKARAVQPDLPFIMITGDGEASSVLAAKESGVSGYITKPFSADELRRKLTAIARIKAHRG